ncbi:hypothetical protein AB0D14_25215 [Streptomyces sp. NPDC048484]|uniref:hypothetical protein n=1 Tax=Streptomyces sp. NPDC048484 TaxID=3155146 RepID=UPI00342A7441
MLRDDWRNILRIIALRVVESCAYCLTATYVLSYITDRDSDDCGGRPVDHHAELYPLAPGEWGSCATGAVSARGLRRGRRPAGRRRRR